MLVSHSKKFIYIKTVKTAGTSIEMALQPYCMPEGLTVTEVTKALVTDAGIVGARGPNIGQEPWRNHMQAVTLKDQLPKDIWENYTKICNIRNPWDKTVSFFHMKFPAIKQQDQAEIVKTFREWMMDVEELGVDTNIYFIDGKPVADVYVKYHSMDADFSALCQKLDLEIDEVPRAKTTQRGGTKIPFQAYFDDASKARVAGLYSQEIAYFDWKFD